MELVKLIQVKRKTVVARWVRKLKATQSGYRHRPVDELEATTAGHLDAVTVFLERGDNAPLRAFLFDIARMRSQMDFALADTLRACLIGEEVLVSVARPHFKGNLRAFAEAQRLIDRCFDETICLYAECYQELEVAKAREQSAARARAEAEARYLQMMRQSEKLAVLGTLTASLAHEVGTPLNIILGRAEQNLAEIDPDCQRAQNLRIIFEQVERITQLVKRLLDFTRAHKPARQPLDVNEVVRRTMTLLDWRTREGRAVVKLELAEDLPPVLGEGNDLEQVLVNLVMNGLQAMSEGGCLTIRTERAGHDGRGWVIATVQDTGCGIPAEHLAQIFDPFFTTKGRGEGTGLGLAIARNIVQELGGTIAVASTPGEGSSFQVRLPAAERAGTP
ncbi:MAG: RsbRD N-terminal domain-containing protein [Deltaproteobacteria bacterium]|nr:RsbRD N-terminal domain-containing protein [Deltaproteobacteria bacterium]MBI3078079.1 RsbRD N-terminal domain-containing protein [Deltaproteobacteria bacterium]